MLAALRFQRGYHVDRLPITYEFFRREQLNSL